ncbi:cyclic peptide export ABC transporter [Virgibacillus pantothenticus]|uniref:cyclic peptide export ABC transporter n=1 Tax=Virgibacillus pantothenticus TaxID=1473 RepID=UPI001C219F47|nr:cyclic peptide export ABC transporter [Virgibacillus pantothenticus]MBU8567931.1 cyclic peptide export ABC transporter [Virgibacillus pantothenticus]MBU8601809.1 cyclic peptide export ABC transporter [Virgibacillus pantothenticus]MBU8635963.1 cyclic peptide export ABC transporter [Virgibacillus pantothenticus]MBU8643647.1 cyclic peptide export ABC transporter [Virgibacillus pantothenticus]MBU8647787.1 cyclic peptide export ABC transporter [Virgibacillus pantothenticus]
MKNQYSRTFFILFCVFFLSFNSVAFAQDTNELKIQKIDEYIQNNYSKLKTPGISVGIVLEGKEHFLNYGYSDVEKNLEVTAQTNFETGSLTKALTSLAITKLEGEGRLSLEDKVSKFFPQFEVVHKGSKFDITVRQLLHHTSGIGSHTVSLLREDGSEGALNNLVSTLNGIELMTVPGSTFEYATVNYGLLGAIIEKVSNKSYESFIEEEIFPKLGMNNSFVGMNPEKNISNGYKISYFKPRTYSAPIFRNNYPAGYIVSNTTDMMKWLQLQLGNATSELETSIHKLHEPDKSVEPINNTFYTRGWFHIINKHDEIAHSGENPNFSAYISFSKKYNSGVVILANSNSENFYELSKNIKDYIYGVELNNITNQSSKFDSIFSTVLIISVLISLFVITYIAYLLLGIIKKRRDFAFEKSSLKKMTVMVSSSLFIIYGIYLLPQAIAGVDWYTVKVWGPESFHTSMLSVIILIGLTNIAYVLSLLFPNMNPYIKEAPEIITLSLVAGVSNSVIIFLITNSLSGQSDLSYLLYYFLVSFYIYVFGRRALEIKLSELTQLTIKSVRETILNRLLKVNYEEFEKIESGKLTSTITTDINQISGLAGLIVVMVTSVVTILAAFCYLAIISATGTLTILGVITVVANIYAYYGSRARQHFEVARETQNTFMSKIEVLISGFKDLSLHRNKKDMYRNEINILNNSFVTNNMRAFKMFVNAFMLGESLFIIVLVTIAFGFTFLFPALSNYELTTFILILLYILGPINGILNSYPRLMQIKVAVDRVKNLLNQLPKVDDRNDTMSLKPNISVSEFSVDNISYEYQRQDGLQGFSINSIQFHIGKGEILFIIGGNGSGKSTLLKIITGLYKPKSGSIRINGQAIHQSEIGEYLSAVFSDSHLFETLYNVNLKGKKEMAEKYLKNLNLEEKVKISEGRFSTTLLSTGQKKRLHLLRCYLEEKEIFVFDEIAADQDPFFRTYFYRVLLPEMKEMGKIVIVVTHDDHYFDEADKIVKLDIGRMTDISEDYLPREKDISLKGVNS